MGFVECSQKLITQIPKSPLTLRQSVGKDFWEEQNEINPHCTLFLLTQILIHVVLSFY